MSDRIVRASILKSEKVNALSWEAEVFYRRLMSVVDDFGLYDAATMVLRADLYPLKVDEVRGADIERHLAAVAEVGLVRLYSVAGKPYLEVVGFNQRLRAMRSRFPRPDGEGPKKTAPADKREAKPVKDGGEAPTTPEPAPAKKEPPASCPKTEEEALKLCHGQLIAVPDDFIRRCFNQLDAVGWLDAAHRPVDKFGAYVKKAYAQHKDNPRGGRNQGQNYEKPDHEKGF